MTRWAVVVFALVAIGLGVSIEMRVRSLESELVPKILQRIAMQTLTTSWRSKHTTQTVTTVQQSGESLADFTKRHNDTVTLQLAAWPADNT